MIALPSRAPGVHSEGARHARADPTVSGIVLVACVLLAAAASAAAFGADTWLADRLYAWQGNTWALKDAFITSRIVHEGGRAVSAAAWIGVLIAWLATAWSPRLRALRAPLGWLLATTLLAAVLVALAKAQTNMDCPWDLVRYGGDRAFFPLFSTRPADVPRGACFPAGHASGGYAWLSLVFFLRETRPDWQRAGFALAVAAGLTFGVGQQLRGAHFLSHDLVTAALCWLVAGMSWRYAWPRGTRKPA